MAKSFATPAAFKTSLEARLRTVATQRNEPQQFLSAQAGIDIHGHHGLNLRMAGQGIKLLVDLGQGEEANLRGSLLVPPHLPHGVLVRRHAYAALVHPAFQFHQVHRLYGIGLAIGRGIGVEDCGKVGGRLGGSDHRQGIAAELGKQRNGRRDLWDAPALAGPFDAVVVDEPGNEQEVLAVVAATVAYYSGLGYRVESVEKDNKGWDLDAVHQNLNVGLKLEVKGLAGQETCVEVTPNEYAKMKEHRDVYRLCVVTDALKSPQLAIFSYSGESHEWQDQKGRTLRIEDIIAARCRADSSR